MAGRIRVTTDTGNGADGRGANRLMQTAVVTAVHTGESAVAHRETVVTAEHASAAWLAHTTRPWKSGVRAVGTHEIPTRGREPHDRVVTVVDPKRRPDDD
jgi:hypothetical protein